MNDILHDLSVTEHYAFKYQDDYILMDVNTLDVYLLDQLEYRIIRALKYPGKDNRLRKLKNQYGEKNVSEKANELFQSGILKYKLSETKANGGKANGQIQGTIRSMDLHLAENCNLACTYCFVKNVPVNGKSSLMSPLVGKKAVDFLLQRSGNYKDLFICFFGGEPLLNFSLLQDIVKYCTEKGLEHDKRFFFSITTNGTILSDEIIGFFHKNGIKVTISIDGDMSSNNLNRPSIGGENTYAAIVAGLKRLNEYNINYAARVTVSTQTVNNLAENFEHLISLGFKRIHIENAFGPKDEIFIRNRKDIEKVNKQFSLIVNKIKDKIKSNDQIYSKTIPLPLGRIMDKRIASHSCTAGRGYVAVDVHGDIYLCHRLVGEKKFWLGNVFQGTFDHSLPVMIEDRLHVENKSNCKRCWARHICGGGCYAVNYEFTQDISVTPSIYCQQKKHSIKLALALYAHTAQQVANINPEKIEG